MIRSRTNVNDSIVEYILHHIGIVDHSTVISIETSLLYPSIPSYPLFQPIPFGLEPDPSTYHHLLNLLTWNEYYYQYQYLHSQNRAEESIPFVFAPSSVNSRHPAPYSSKAMWVLARQLFSSIHFAPSTCPASSSTFTISPSRAAVMLTLPFMTFSFVACNSLHVPC